MYEHHICTYCLSHAVSVCLFPCLICIQGDIITVIKRVDENWGEGKLGDKVGIFPLQFTEVRLFKHLQDKTFENSIEGLCRFIQ